MTPIFFLFFNLEVACRAGEIYKHKLNYYFESRYKQHKAKRANKHRVLFWVEVVVVKKNKNK